jgi:hypothetical protein
LSAISTAIAVRSTVQPFVQFFFPTVAAFFNLVVEGNMQRLVLVIFTLGLFLLNIPSAGSNATDSEIDAIRAVADAYISADPAHLRDALPPEMGTCASRSPTRRGTGCKPTGNTILRKTPESDCDSSGSTSNTIIAADIK